MKNLFPNNSRKKQKPSDPDSSAGSDYLDYSSIAYYIIATISVGIFAGYLLDRFTGWSFPVFKVIFSFGSVIVALYIVFRKLNNNKKK